MRRLGLLLFVAVPAVCAAGPAQPECSEWRTCRELAVAAAERRDYQAFHDLAWRTVQTGPRNDPSLMFLLARAQALSGRPHDALVMLERIGPHPIASEAVTDAAFESVRQLPDWPALEARLKNETAPATTAAPATAPATVGIAPSASSAAPPAAPTPNAPTAPARNAARNEARPTPPAPVPGIAGATTAEAGHFSLNQFRLAGLAYDSVSERFILADQSNRKIVIVGKGTNHGVDLVRADSAGFQNITALAINGARGDLWVASGDGGAATLHRVQLVSGRPLRSYPLNLRDGSIRIVDLAVAKDDAILALDDVGGQLFQLRAGNTTFEPPVRIDAQTLTSVTAADNRVAYVSHRDGLIRVDLQNRRTAKLPLPADFSIGRIEQIRMFGDDILAVTAREDGTYWVRKLELNAAGTAIRRVLTVDIPVSIIPPLLTVAGSDLFYMLPASSGNGAPAADTSEYVVHTIRLK